MRSPRFWTIAAVATVALILYTVGLDYSPPYLHEAEVLFGLHAHAIATTGHDVYGRFMPLYFQMTPLGENTWWHPVLVYVTALWLQVGPLTESSLRMPSALIGATNVVLLYLIARRLFAGPRLAVLAAALLIITPAHFVQSRIAMDYIYPLPFLLAWTLCLLRFLDDKRPVWLFAATSLLGLGVYSYIASVIMMPFYAVVTAGVLIVTGCRAKPLWAAAVLGFFWPLLAIPTWLWFHPDVINQTLVRYTAQTPTPVAGKTIGLALPEVLEELRKPEHFSNLPGRVSLYWYFFDPGYLFVTGGYASPMNSTRHVGVFLAPFIVLLPLGLWHVATRPALRPVLVAIGFFSAPLAAVLAVPEPYAIDREMALVPFGVLLAIYGVERARSSASPWVRRSALVALLVVPLHFAFFLYDYFVDYRPRAGFWFGLNHRGALEAVIHDAERQPVHGIYLNVHRDPFLEAYWLFALAKWDRQNLRAKTVVVNVPALSETIEAMPVDSLVLLNRNDVDADVRRALEEGTFVRVLDVAEIGDEQLYTVLRKTCCAR